VAGSAGAASLPAAAGAAISPPSVTLTSTIDL